MPPKGKIKSDNLKEFDNQKMLDDLYKKNKEKGSSWDLFSTPENPGDRGRIYIFDKSRGKYIELVEVGGPYDKYSENDYIYFDAGSSKAKVFDGPNGNELNRDMFSKEQLDEIDRLESKRDALSDKKKEEEKRIHRDESLSTAFKHEENFNREIFGASGDISYELNNNRLSEDEIVACTIIASQNSKDINEARLKTKSLLEEYDRTGNEKLLSDFLVNNLKGESINVSSELGSKDIDKLSKAYFVNNLLSKPNLLELAKKDANEKGNLDELLGAVKNNSVMAGEYTFHKERVLTDIKGRENTIETDKEFFKKEGKVGSSLSTLINMEHQLMDNTLTGGQVPGILSMISSEKGREAIEDFIGRNNISINSNSSMEEKTRAYNKLVKSGLIPDNPILNGKNLNSDTLNSYFKECETMKPDDISRTYFDGVFNKENHIEKSKLGKELEDDLVSFDISEPVNKKDDFSGLKYNRDIARRRIENIDQGLSKEDYLKAKRDIISEECLNALYLGQYINQNPNASKLDIADKSIEISSWNKSERPEYIFVKSYKGNNLGDILRYTQNNFAGKKSEKQLQEGLKNQFDAFSDYALTSAAIINKNEEYGRAYEIGLFASTPDGKGMQFTNLEDGVEEKLRAWQEDVEKVVIRTTPKYKEDIIRFTVFGECLKDEHLKKAARLSDSANELREASSSNVVETCFYQNMMAGDRRLNSHAFRSIVAESRIAAKDMIENDKFDKVKENLGRAFNSLYKQARVSSNTGSNEWKYAVRNMTKFLNVCKENNIDIKELGITDKQLSGYRTELAKYDIRMKIDTLHQDIMNNYNGYVLSGGEDYKFDPHRNSELNDKLMTYINLRQVDHILSSDVEHQKYIFSGGDPRYFEDRQMNRDNTSMEDLFISDPDKFIEYNKVNVGKSGIYRDFMGAKSFKDLEYFYRNLSTSDTVKLYNSSSAIQFENGYMDGMLSNIKEGIKKEKSELNRVMKRGWNVGDPDIYSEEDLNLRNEYDKICLSDLKEIDKSIKAVEKLRSEIKGNLTDDNLKKLGNAYKDISDKINDYYRHLPDELSSSASSLAFQGMGGTLENLCEDINNMEKVREEEENIITGMNDISNYGLTYTSKSLDGYMDSMDKRMKGKAKLPAYEGLKEDINEYRARMNGIYSKDEITTEDIENCMEASIKLTEKLAIIKAQGLGKDIKFLCDGLGGDLEKDLTVLKSMEHDSGLSFKDGFNKGGRTKAYKDELKERLDLLAGRLESVKDRFGGNSKEFTNMYNDVMNMRGKDLRDDEALNLLNKLNSSTDKYISEKKDVPSTDKGKDRLQIAKELKELCGDLKPEIKKSVEKEAKNHSILRESSAEKLSNMKEKAIKGMKEGLERKDKGKVLDSLSELIYLNEVSANEKRLTEDRLNNMLDKSVMDKVVENLTEVTSKVVNAHPEMVFKSNNTGDIQKEILSNFKEAYKVTEKEMNVVNKNAEISDNIIAKERERTLKSVMV